MFKSFFSAGFECATGYNLHGEWIDQVAATDHDRLVDHDYELLASVGIHSAREAMRWPLIDRGASYDFSSVVPVTRAALRHGIELVWDLFHYGYPDDCDLFSDAFPARFAEYCHAAARFVARHLPGPYYFTPVNEASYFSWAGGEVARFAPHARGRGQELKVALAKATIAAVDAIKSACAGARIVTVDPICNVVAPHDADGETMANVWRFNHRVVFEYMDMISGRLLPELGGSRAHLDVVGINYYWTNQWQLGHDVTPLADTDPRKLPLGELVRRTFRRYGGEVVLTETSALGEARAGWVEELSAMAVELLDEGVPLKGICLYPILGMPEWHDRKRWTRMGLWDLLPGAADLRRVLHEPMYHALRRAQRSISARAKRRLSGPGARASTSDAGG